MIIATTVLPDATVASYSYQLTAINAGSSPSWSMSGLPAGLSLGTATGLISGTPTAAGVYHFTVSVTTSTNTDTQDFTLTVK